MKDLFARAARSRRARAASIRVATLVVSALALAATERRGLALEPEVAEQPTGREGAEDREPHVNPPFDGSDAAADWPGCGGVCALHIGPDFVILDMTSVEPPGTPLRLTLTLFSQDGAGREQGLEVDVTDCLEDGTLLVDAATLGALEGGAITAASLAWEGPITLGSGGEELPVSG
jgi:hypothetical protein